MPNKVTDLYYIFLITNKSQDISGEIYDLQNNALYSTNEIEISVQDEANDYLIGFLQDAKKIVTRRYAYSNIYCKDSKPASPQKKDKEKDNQLDFGYGINDYDGFNGYGYDDYDDDSYWSNQIYRGKKK